MVLSLPWRIALRYLRAGKRAQRNSFISFISLVSVLGIGLGVAALIIVLSVMNGFQKDVRDRMLSVLPHIEVRVPPEQPIDWQALQATLAQHPSVAAQAVFSVNQGMLVRDAQMQGILLRGIEPTTEAAVTSTPLSFTAQGFTQLRAGEFGAVIGTDLARKFGLVVGDRFNLMLAEGSISPAGFLPRFKLMTVVDIFESGHYEYDSGLIYTHVGDLQALARNSQPDGIRIRIKQIDQAPLIRYELQSLLYQQPQWGGLVVNDWAQQNRNWFAAVQTEKRLLAIILTLIIAVAAFNLVSSLVMTVTEKHADIAILRTLGASTRTIMQIFVIQGSLAGIIGTLAGVGFGVLVALNVDVIVPVIEAIFQVQFLPKEIYLVSTLPSDVHWQDVLSITAISLALAFLATLYPSFRAARIDPAQTLRYS